MDYHIHKQFLSRQFVLNFLYIFIKLHFAFILLDIISFFLVFFIYFINKNVFFWFNIILNLIFLPRFTYDLWINNMFT